MKRFFPLLLAALLLSVATGRADETELESLEEQAFKEAAALVEPSVVRIQTVGGLDRVGQVLTGTGPTTGVVVSEDGFIISSAFNFASKPTAILVQLPDGRRFTAEIVANDFSKMLTLLKIDLKELTPAVAAPKDTIKVGQWSIALGRTYENQFPSMSVGIVSALNRINGKAMQTDAKISPVNYGGPLINVKGEVMGILVPLSQQGGGETAGVEWYDSGIGFAISMEEIYANLDRLKSGEDLHPGLLGITLKDQGKLGTEPVIDRVREASPASEAGFKAGDTITEINGQKIVRQMEIKQYLGNRYAGDKLTITIQRGEETISKEVTLVEKLEAYESGYLGILPRREELGKQADPGVGVRFVFAGSPAEKAGLQTRDRIVKVGETEVKTPEELLDEIGRKKPEEKVQLTWLRDGKESTAEVTLAAIPNEVPAEIRTQAIPAPEAPAEGVTPPKTGRFTVEMPAQEHSYWAYVPESYNPAYAYGMIVWIHPNGDTMEAALFKQWKSICDLRGIIILAPKAADISGWNLNEAEFVKDAIADMQGKYSIDPSRIFLHGYATGGSFAYHLTFKFRELIRGLAMAGSPISGQAQENSPDNRLQFYFTCGEQDPNLTRVKMSVQLLQNAKFPVTFTPIPETGEAYPPEAILEELARWADILDRI